MSSLNGDSNRQNISVMSMERILKITMWQSYFPEDKKKQCQLRKISPAAVALTYGEFYVSVSSYFFFKKMEFYSSRQISKLIHEKVISNEGISILLNA